jgi:CheY-like chemotaxis protein
MDEKEFLRALKESSPDLVLSDYDLPQHTGSLALAAAKKLRPEVPFIFVTGATRSFSGLY